MSNEICRSLMPALSLGTLLLAVVSYGSAPQNSRVLEDAARRIQLGQYQSAADLIEPALKRQPETPELWNLLGIAETELHQSAAARSAFEHGLRLARDSVSLHENLGLLFYREADYPNAKKFLSEAVTLGSDKPGVLFSLAAARLRTGETQRALADLRSLEVPLGKVSAYWDERGRAESLEDPAAAERSFSRALELEPDDVTALNGAASAAERQHLDEKALSYLIKARQAHPDDVLTLAHFGSVCIRRDLGVDALDALTRAHQLAPSNNSILFLLARANVALSNWQAAYDLFSEFSKRVPAYAPVYYALGWVDVKLDRTGDARLQFQHCLLLDPKLTDARFELAQLEVNDGNLDTAHHLLATVLQEQPHAAKASLAMGDLLMRQGDLHGAETYLQAAIQQSPKLAAAHYKLSMLFFRTGRMKQAESEKTIAARLNTEADRASKIQLKLILPDSDLAQ
jgi:tetratricopeptide (TPR) repeat protein